LEKQLKPQELADLFALLTLDKPPSDTSAKKLPGAQPIAPRETTDPAQFAELVQQVAAGFSTSKAGKAGLAIVEEHAGREGVLRTCPVSRQEPCVLRAAVDVPDGKRTRLVLSVSSDPRGSWNLTVNANGNRLHQGLIGPASTFRWQTISLDLSPLAGKKVNLELLNATQSGKVDSAFWGQVEIISE